MKKAKRNPLHFKIIVSLSALMFGFCQNIAAQYGVVVDFLIKGRVLSQSSQQPIPGIRVEAGGNIPIVTDAEGKFTVESRSMSDEIRLSFGDADGDTNGRYIPKDTISGDNNDFVVYLKEEPTVEQFLKEHPDFPLVSDGKTIEYTAMIYVHNAQIGIKLDRISPDKHKAYCLKFNDTEVKSSKENKGLCAYDLELVKKYNYCTFSFNNDNKNKESATMFIEDWIEKQSWKANKKAGKIEGFILIHINL
jgi:putative lipoprotein (rSAM/lipoprotein system)